MKKTILFLKAVMLFITAIWGIILGILVPVTILADPHSMIEGVPAHASVLWLVTAVAGFVVPCFLVMLKLYKVAACIAAAGIIPLFITHSVLSAYTINGFGWFYLPLSVESIVIVMIAVYANRGEIRRKRYRKQKAKNAPAPSILGGGTYKAEEASNSKKSKHSKPKGKK
jgi:hypothetical protein